MTCAQQLRDEVKALALDIEEIALDYDNLAAYFEDVLDVEFIVDRCGDYRGARITLAIGGPGIFLNTRKSCIEGYWWSDYAEYHVKAFAVDAVDEYFSELWEMSRGY